MGEGVGTRVGRPGEVAVGERGTLVGEGVKVAVAVGEGPMGVGISSGVTRGVGDRIPSAARRPAGERAREVWMAKTAPTAKSSAPITSIDRKARLVAISLSKLKRACFRSRWARNAILT